jgi:hypothetical protein
MSYQRCGGCRDLSAYHTYSGDCRFKLVSPPVKDDDAVNHPAHYNWLPVEVIEITERFDYVLGNCLKYILRHQHKGKPLEDLKKARWYLERAIQNMEKGS